MVDRNNIDIQKIQKSFQNKFDAVVIAEAVASATEIQNRESTGRTRKPC